MLLHARSPRLQDDPRRAVAYQAVREVGAPDPRDPLGVLARISTASSLTGDLLDHDVGAEVACGWRGPWVAQLGRDVRAAGATVEPFGATAASRTRAWSRYRWRRTRA